MRATIAIGALMGFVLLPAGAVAKAGERCDTVVRKYVVTYTGSWHSEGFFPAGEGTGSYSEDASWDLRSRGAPIKMTSSRCGPGAVAGGVVTGEMRGSAVKNSSYTETGFPTESSSTSGPDILDATLDADEGTNKRHQLGASGADYTSYGDKDKDVYPMEIDSRRPRKSYALKIAGSQSTSGPGTQDSASIQATWTLELASKRPGRD